jgi:hypothetical protein
MYCLLILDLSPVLLFQIAQQIPAGEATEKDVDWGRRLYRVEDDRPIRDLQPEFVAGRQLEGAAD